MGMNPERYRIILMVLPHMLSIIFARLGSLTSSACPLAPPCGKTTRLKIINGLLVLILEWSMGTEMISPGWGRPIWPGLLLECS